jgi:hypothetical protein
MSLSGFIFRQFYEWAAKGKSYEDLLRKLQKNETTTHSRMQNANDSAWNRSRAVHVIGIERWGAHRLRVLLGEPLVIDEYDGYAPSDTLSMVELAQAFKKTRATTSALVRELQAKGISLSQTVKHNDVGDLSVGAWIFYLENHMGRETFFLQQQMSSKRSGVTES